MRLVLRHVFFVLEAKAEFFAEDLLQLFHIVDCDRDVLNPFDFHRMPRSFKIRNGRS
jgi:hypothetical protein